MSDELTKEKHSRRIQKTQNKIKRQQDIAKVNHVNVKDPHRFAKKHAMNCGNPKCIMCSNPRHVWNEKTKQEISFEQTDKWE